MSVLIQSLSRTPSIFPLQTFILFMVSNVYVGSSLFAFLRNLGSFLSFLVWCFVMCKILLRSHACRSNHMCSFVKEPPSNTSLQLYVYKCLECLLQSCCFNKICSFVRERLEFLFIRFYLFICLSVSCDHVAATDL